GSAFPTLVTVWALRSDGNVFSAVTSWPRDPNGDPTFPFVQDSATPPAGLRSITWVSSYGLLGGTTNNQLFQRTNTGWAVVPGVGSYALLAGAPSGAGWSLPGADATSTVLGSLTGLGNPKQTQRVPALPHALTTETFNTTDPNQAFTIGGGTFGQATP